MDAFDRWWAWARKPLASIEMIPADIHNPVMALPEADRRDRELVNEAVRANGRAATSTEAPARSPGPPRVLAHLVR
jgi:hypothetical protein